MKGSESLKESAMKISIDDLFSGPYNFESHGGMPVPSICLKIVLESAEEIRSAMSARKQLGYVQLLKYRFRGVPNNESIDVTAVLGFGLQDGELKRALQMSYRFDRTRGVSQLSTKVVQTIEENIEDIAKKLGAKSKELLETTILIRNS